MSIKIENNGPALVWTNYWESQYAAQGYVYLSINAGCFRLLVPKGKGIPLDDMREASVVLITRGPWPEIGKYEALEIIFDDGSDEPSFIHIAADLVDRMPVDSDRDRPGQPPRWILSVYNQDGKQLELPARYRKAKKIPYLKRWEE